jgi:hypothetical protein
MTDLVAPRIVMTITAWADDPITGTRWRTVFATEVLDHLPRGHVGVVRSA